VERCGAPVEANIRVDNRQVLVRCGIYTPNHVVVLDATLSGVVDITQGLMPGER